MLSAMSAPSAQPAAPPKPGLPRWRIILARTLTVIGILLIVISVIANYVEREALDTSHFRGTARELVASHEIQDQLAATLVDQLFSNTDVADTLQQKLPENLQSLAVPLAGLARSAADSAAKELLSRPRVQDLFVTAATTAQKSFIAVLDDDQGALTTTNGDVVLDLRPILTRLGERFDVVEEKIPPDAGRIVLMRSEQLDTGQKLVQALRYVAAWIWALALAAWAVAILLVPGRRRLEVRAMAIGILASGFLILIIRTISERYFVNRLVESDSVRPSAKDAFEIITDSLKGAGWTAVIIGVVALAGVWLTGSGRRAVQARQFLAPHLAGAGIYGATIGGYLLLLWWKPTPQFGYWLNIVIFFVLILIGTEVLRRQLARERPPEPAPAT
jgi:hypothetical protein